METSRHELYSGTHLVQLFTTTLDSQRLTRLKVNCLRSLLTGVAFGGLMLTATNYVEAIEVLNVG